MFVSYTLYKDKDAWLWLDMYLNSFKPIKPGWLDPWKLGHLRYKPNTTYPMSPLDFQAYQQFLRDLIKVPQTRDLLVDFLESGEGCYQDSLPVFIEKLKASPNWPNLKWIID